MFTRWLVTSGHEQVRCACQKLMSAWLGCSWVLSSNMNINIVGSSHLLADCSTSWQPCPCKHLFPGACQFAIYQLGTRAAPLQQDTVPGSRVVHQLRTCFSQQIVARRPTSPMTSMAVVTSSSVGLRIAHQEAL